MQVAIKVGDKVGEVDVPSSYTKIVMTSGTIHSYIVGLEPHQVKPEMIFLPSAKTIEINNKTLPLWELRKD